MNKALCTCPNSAHLLAGVGALVLDFDGTLADTAPDREHALRLALRAHGLHLDHDWYRRHMGLSIHDLLAALPGGAHLPRNEVIRASRAHLLAQVHTIAPIRCVLLLVRSARRAQLPCAVASGASSLLVHPGLEALGLTQQFEATITREDALRGKPAPDLYLAAAQSLQVRPDQCLAVDDTPDGVASARMAGMRVATVVDGHVRPLGNGAQDRSAGTAARWCSSSVH